jgi:hypothetical protein
MGAPARTITELLKAGGKRELTCAPYGWFTQGNDPACPDKTAQVLPVDDYELTLTVQLRDPEQDPAEGHARTSRADVVGGHDR